MYEVGEGEKTNLEKEDKEGDEIVEEGEKQEPEEEQDEDMVLDDPMAKEIDRKSVV